MTTLGSYTLQKELGRGGLGVMWAATDGMGTKYAVKVLCDELSGDEEYLKLLDAETRAVHSLQSANLVPLLNAGFDAGKAYITYEYRDCPVLQDMLEREGRFAVPDVLRVARGMLAGIEALHGAGFMHGGISPRNVLIEKGMALLTDTGQARHDGAIGVRIEDGAVVGLPHFIAPEQYIDGEPQTPAVDIYSAGAVLYYLFTSRPPFQAADLTSLIQQVLETQPPDPRAIRPDVPAAAAELIIRSMNKSPGERPASVSEFHAALDSATPSVDSGGIDVVLDGVSMDNSPVTIAMRLQPPQQTGNLELIPDLWLPGYEPPEPTADIPGLDLSELDDEVFSAPAEGHETPPEPGTSACLSIEPGPGDPYRIFLFPRRRLQFGRNSGDTSGNQFALRMMPQAQFADESKRISGKHLATEFADGEWYVADLNSSNGTTLDRKLMAGGKPLPFRTAVRLNVGGVLQMMLTPCESAPVDEKIFSETDKPRSISMEVGIEKDFSSDALVMTRQNNTPHHVYVQILRHVIIGGEGTVGGVELDVEEIPREAVRIFYRRGFFFIASKNAAVETSRHGLLPPRKPFPLLPGDTGRIEKVTFKFLPVEWSLFKGR